MNKTNKRLVFIIKDGCKLELGTPEIMKLFGSTKKLIDKKENGEHVPILEVVEVGIVQCNLVDNQYQQKSEVLHTSTPNKCYAYLLNVEPSNLVFLKTYNAEFDEIIITFTDQNERPFEVEDTVNLKLLTNSLKTAAKIIIHKAAEGRGEFIGNKIADKIVDVNSRNAEEIVIPPEKREEILIEGRQVL